MTLACVIIDDEPLARECIAGYVRKVDFLSLVGEGNNPIVLEQLLDEQDVDLIFLDIQMPVISGIDFLKMKDRLPPVVITTAFPNYALEGFQLNVLDYLLKPITFGRFFQAVNKVKDYQNLTHPPVVATPDYFFIKCDGRYEKIRFDEIIYVQAMQNYVIIRTLREKFITLLYLKHVEEYLAGQPFIRVHKSYIVATSKIESIEENQVLVASFPVPIGRNYRSKVIESVVSRNLWKK